MELREAVRELRPDEALSESQIDNARVRLASRIETLSEKGRGSRRRARRYVVGAGFALGAAAAVTAGVVMIVQRPAPPIEAIPTTPAATRPASPSPATTAPSTPPEPELTAASAFGAAAAVVHDRGAGYSAGEYLRIASVSEFVAYYDEVNGVGEFAADRTSAEGAWVVRSGMELYAPADEAAPWRARAGQSELLARYGDAEPGIAMWERDGGLTAAPTEPYSLEGGPFPPWAGEDGAYTMSSFLRSMPADPEAAIDWGRAHLVQGGSDSGDSKVGWIFVDLLATNAGTSAQRAVMYEALAALDGSRIVSSEGDIVTLAFSSAFEAEEGFADSGVHTVKIDLTSGRVLETTETRGSGSALIPDDVPDVPRTFTYSVVDEAP